MKSIISVLIFSAFVEILIPKESYKKYIGIVMGFIIMLVIISPLSRFFGKGSVPEVIRTYDFRLQSAADSIGSSLDISKGYGTGLVSDIYKNDISESVEASLAEKGINSKVSSIDIDDDASSKTYGRIKSIGIDVFDSENESDIYVPGVKVEVGKYFKEETPEKKEEQGIYDVLSKSYGINEENVYIQKR